MRRAGWSRLVAATQTTTRCWLRPQRVGVSADERTSAELRVGLLIADVGLAFSRSLVCVYTSTVVFIQRLKHRVSSLLLHLLLLQMTTELC